MSELDTLSAAALAPDVKDIAGTPDSEAIDRDVRTTPREMTVARYVNGVFQVNEQYAVRQGYHDQMRASWRVCRSEYTAAEKQKLAALGIPDDVSEPVVELRKFIAQSQMKEIFSTSGNFPARLSSTAHPDLPDYITEMMLKRMLDELAQISMEAGMAPTPEMAAQFARDRMAEMRNAEREYANDQIALLERRVRDDFEEADFMSAFNQGIEYLTVFGTTLWEGPVPCMRWKNDWSSKGKLSRKAKPGVAFRAISPLDVYPSPDQSEVDDGPICIKVRFSPNDLWLNATEAGGDDAENGVWFRDTVTDLLAKYPQGGVRLSWQDGDEENKELKGHSTWVADSSCMMEGISYYGEIRGNLLLRMGVIRTHEGKAINPDDFYEVNAIVIDDYCVYCRIINPCMGRPLSKAQFYEATDSFFGTSIAQRLIAYQRVMNGCLQSLIVNMNMTAAPQAWISDASRLLDKTPTRFKLIGGKVWAFKATTAGVATPNGPPMGILRVDSRINDILAVMNMAIKRIDDVSEIPSYTYGQNVTGGAGRTYSGLAMLTEASNRSTKMRIDNLSSKCINKMVRMDAYRLMLYDDSIGYTGDVEVIPTGVMGLILKQQEMQKVLQLMQMVAGNQFLVQTVGARGLMELFRQVLETYEIANIDKIIPSKADLDLQDYVARLKSAAGAQTAVNQAQQPQPGAEGGNPQLPPPSEQSQGGGAADVPRTTYERSGMEYRMPIEPNPGSANERRGAA
jgi:hypothetical protein